MPPKIFFQILDVFLYHMVDAAIAPPVGGRPGQPAAAEVRDGDEGIFVVARGGGGRAPPPAIEMTTARGLGLNLADSATDAAGESSNDDEEEGAVSLDTRVATGSV
jgi:hypothetical protein